MGKLFAYADVPALMPLLVGRHARAALAPSIALHIRGGNIETITHARVDDRVIADHLALHRALAKDHEALLASWRAAAGELGGRVESAWPPVLAIPRMHGPATITLRWSDSPAIGSEAAIELGAHAHGAPLWSLRREAVDAPNCITIADQSYLVLGPFPIPLAELVALVARTGVTQIGVRRHATIRIGRTAPEPEVLAPLLGLLDAMCAATTDPYR